MVTSCPQGRWLVTIFTCEGGGCQRVEAASDCAAGEVGRAHRNRNTFVSLEGVVHSDHRVLREDMLGWEAEAACVSRQPGRTLTGLPPRSRLPWCRVQPASRP